MVDWKVKGGKKVFEGLDQGATLGIKRIFEYLLPRIVQYVLDFGIHERVRQLVLLYHERRSFLFPKIVEDVKHISSLNILGSDFYWISYTFAGVFLFIGAMRNFYIDHVFTCVPINTITHQSFQCWKIQPGITVCRTMLNIVRDVILSSAIVNIKVKVWDTWLGLKEGICDPQQRTYQTRQCRFIFLGFGCRFFVPAFGFPLIAETTLRRQSIQRMCRSETFTSRKIQYR